MSLRKRSGKWHYRSSSKAKSTREHRFGRHSQNKGRQERSKRKRGNVLKIGKRPRVNPRNPFSDAFRNSGLGEEQISRAPQHL